MSKRIKIDDDLAIEDQTLEFQLGVKGAEDDQEGDSYIDRFHAKYTSEHIAEWRQLEQQPHKLCKVNSQEPGLLVSSTLEAPLSQNIVDSHVKMRMVDHWSEVRDGRELSRRESLYWSMLNNYSDIFDVSAPSSPDKQMIQQMYAAHVVNHVLKYRDRVIKGNLKLKRTQGHAEVRDRGFCRATVLVLLPMRNMALEFVQDLLQHYPNLERVDGKDTFIDEFSEESSMDYSRKPADFQHTFRGNADDSFRVGIKLSRKRVKLFSDFYNSDIVVASPLGLRTLYDEDGSKNDGTYDFLSTVQVAIVDGMDIMMMQNWTHLEFVFEQLNQVPKLPRSTDFARLQNVYAEGAGRFLRQTCCFSNLETTEFRSLFGSFCRNRERSLIRAALPGCIDGIRSTTKQLFNRFESETAVDDADQRFEFFTGKVLPEIVQGGRTGVLLYVPSYFDFVRLRNYAAKQFLACEAVCEYSTQAEQTRARALFADGKVSFLLYTERFHFYKRYAIKGVNSVLFYQPPLLPHFYNEILASIPESVVDAIGIVLYSSIDRLSLQRIVGSKRANKMIKSKSCATHVIC